MDAIEAVGDTRPESGPHPVEVTVNEHPVVVQGPRATGLAIKEAAIAQGLPIKTDFVLSEELEHGRTRIVGDSDVVTVTKHSRFDAVAPDDNS